MKRRMIQEKQPIVLTFRVTEKEAKKIRAFLNGVTDLTRAHLIRSLLQEKGVI